MVILLIMKKYPLDEVVFYDTGMEFDAIYKNEKKLKRILKRRGIGYKRIVPEKSFVYLAFEHKCKRRDGTICVGYDWCGGLRRWGTSQKNREIEKYYKSKYGDADLIVEYVGIAKDELKHVEKQRIKRGVIFRTKNGKTLDRSNIWKEMKALCKDAGVESGKVFPHNLRHLFARTFYGLEKDIARLADLLGHSNIATTRIYAMESGKEHEKQINRMKLILSQNIKTGVSQNHHQNR